MRFFLNGFMGSGKSTIGKHLAQLMVNSYFVDLDDFIEEKTFSKINLLFKQFGEAEFRKIEHEYLLDLAVYQNMVVACGGGTITNQNNEKWMNENGVTIFIDENFDTIFSRLNHENEIEKRPILKAMNEDKFKEELANLFEARNKNYSRCKLKIKPSKDAKSTAEAIYKELQKQFTNI